MQVTEIIFLINAAFLVLFSLAVVVIKNPVRATFMLILSFLPTTAIYFFLHAPFVGILQILVYAGAILVLFTFVVMMVNPAPGDGEISPDGAKRLPRSRIAAVGIVLLLGGVLLSVVLSISFPAIASVPAEFGGLRAIGTMIFKNPSENPYIFSFELLSFLVLAGIIAAVSIARGREHHRHGPGKSQ